MSELERILQQSNFIIKESPGYGYYTSKVSFQIVNYYKTTRKYNKKATYHLTKHEFLTHYVHKKWRIYIKRAIALLPTNFLRKNSKMTLDIDISKVE